jgi:hypothetical protein
VQLIPEFFFPSISEIDQQVAKSKYLSKNPFRTSGQGDQMPP